MSFVPRWPLSLLLAFTFLVTGCRSGDETACTDREVRSCQRSDERDAVELVFARENYGSCSAAVGNNACGIDAEALRRCVDGLPTPLCVGAPHQQVDPRILFQTTACAEELETYLDCEENEDNRSARSSSDDDEDWYDD